MNRHDHRAEMTPTDAPWAVITFGVLVAVGAGVPPELAAAMVSLMLVRERAEARAGVLVPLLARFRRRDSARGPARPARELADRYTGPPLTCCLDHVTAAARTGPPAGTLRIDSRPEALLTCP
jgi:hypothetical protein